MVLLNRGTANGEISVSWEDLGYPVYLSARVRDLWQAKDLGEHKGMFSAPVALHSVVMVTVKPYAFAAVCRHRQESMASLNLPHAQENRSLSP